MYATEMAPLLQLQDRYVGHRAVVVLARAAVVVDSVLVVVVTLVDVLLVV